MVEAVAIDTSLEEQLLRVLFDGPASAWECAVRLAPFAAPSVERMSDITSFLELFTKRGYVNVGPLAGTTRYTLTKRGSSRLADLVE